jgi:hypothetical protein
MTKNRLVGALAALAVLLPATAALGAGPASADIFYASGGSAAGSAVTAPRGATVASVPARPHTAAIAHGSARAVVYNWGGAGIGVRVPGSTAMGYDYVMYVAAAPVSGYYGGSGWCISSWEWRDYGTGPAWYYYNRAGVGVHYFPTSGKWALKANRGSC